MKIKCSKHGEVEATGAWPMRTTPKNADTARRARAAAVNWEAVAAVLRRPGQTPEELGRITLPPQDARSPDKDLKVFCSECMDETLKKCREMVQKNGYLTAPIYPLQVSEMKVDKNGVVSMSSKFCDPLECTCGHSEEHAIYCPQNEKNRNEE